MEWLRGDDKGAHVMRRRREDPKPRLEWFDPTSYLKINKCAGEEHAQGR